LETDYRDNYVEEKENTDNMFTASQVANVEKNYTSYIDSGVVIRDVR